MRHRLCFLALLTLTLSACGTNVTVGEKHNEQTNDPDGGGGGGGGSGDSGAVAARESIACGTKRCATRKVVLSGTSIDVLPCCFSEAEEACGIASITKCFRLNDKGNPDSSCPPLPSLPFVGTAPGCCRPDNTCGLYDTTVGFGCAQITDFLPPGQPVPDFLTCKYNP